jgi:hypothetical protein
MICANCHGVNANSTGRQATILSEMTGGNANVTDLVDGIMNPKNRQLIFSSAPLISLTVDDWAARYFTWMGLGGTKQKIPQSILSIVANTRVLDQQRPSVAAALDANMLSNAMNLCNNLLPVVQNADAYAPFEVRSTNSRFNFEGGMFERDDGSAVAQTDFIYKNGDALLWEQVCTLDNPPPVRAVTADPGSWSNPHFLVHKWDFYPAGSYPVNSSVVDQRGNVVTGISTGNYFPWCIRQPATSDKAMADAWLSNNLSVNGKLIPYCPDFIKAADGNNDPSHLSLDVLNRWAVRGAINAGLLVFAYLDQLASGDLVPTPSYDQCEQLTP